jgi:DNA processing protein
MTPADTRRAETLLAAARSFRDHWIPVDGSRPSGFVSPRSVTVDDIETVLALNNAPVLEQPPSGHPGDDPASFTMDFASDRYPRRLRDLDGRPALLFVRGMLPDAARPSVAIVGSRKATQPGVTAAEQIASALAENGSLVVSGLAAGIDAAAHEGALSVGGPTLAVMGTGLGRIYPAANMPLAERIVTSGALLTQFPPGYGPTKTTFPARNVLIAGLSDISVLVEMSEHSGTRIEANCAIAQGKQVLLWEPLLRQKKWAQDFAQHPLVRFVSSSTDVVELAG